MVTRAVKTTNSSQRPGRRRCTCSFCHDGIVAIPHVARSRIRKNVKTLKGHLEKHEDNLKP